jgi:hypothetical protein
MDKKVENLRRLVRELESPYGHDDVDVKHLQAELNLLKATRVVTKLAPTPHLNLRAKQQYRSFEPTELTYTNPPSKM